MDLPHLPETNLRASSEIALATIAETQKPQRLDPATRMLGLAAMVRLFKIEHYLQIWYGGLFQHEYLNITGANINCGPHREFWVVGYFERG